MSATRGKPNPMSEPSKGTDQRDPKTADGVSTITLAAGRAADDASGALDTAARGLEAGRQAAIAASGQVTAAARTAWTAIAQRKLVATGIGAGLTALSAASYAVGRRSSRRPQGPLTRLTGGRI